MSLCIKIDIPEKAQYSYVNCSHKVPFIVRQSRNKRQLKKLWNNIYRTLFIKYLMMVDRYDMLWEVYDIQWEEDKIYLYMDRSFTENGIRMIVLRSLDPDVFKEFVDYVKDHISVFAGDWESYISSEDWERYIRENNNGSKARKTSVD